MGPLILGSPASLNLRDKPFPELHCSLILLGWAQDSIVLTHLLSDTQMS